MAGRVFVACGDLTRLSCDAWGLPTDRSGWVTDPWVAAAPTLKSLVVTNGSRQLLESSHLPDEFRGGVARAAPFSAYAEARAEESAARVGSSSLPWLIDLGFTGDEGAERLGSDPDTWPEAAAWYMEGVRQFVEGAASRFADAGTWPTQGSFERLRPLLGLPVVGGGEGGGREFKGFLIREQVSHCSGLAAKHDVDIAIVAYGGRGDSKTFSAAQRARASVVPVPDSEFSASERSVLDSLAGRLREGGLVLFLGAGVSRGAGLPLWDELLDDLAVQGGMEAELEELRRLDEPDRAMVIQARLARANTSTGESVRDAIGKREHVSLLHQLLASLPFAEAATTNYDELFELACRATPRPATVLPAERPGPGERWLLKLHGTLADPESIVLTRDDYMRYRDSRSALAGIVHALLITRHILFVGFGLDDPNFHQIVHDVRRAVGPASKRPGGEPFGTALLLSDRPFSQDIWAGDVEIVSFGSPGQEATAANAMEAFLDELNARSEGAAQYLLDPTFASLLSEPEFAIREALEELEDRASEWPESSPVTVEVRRLLKALGAAA